LLLLPAGTKRSYDEIAQSHKSQKASTFEEDETEPMINWAMFKRWGLLEGTSLIALENDWKDKTSSADTEAVFRRGEWHIPDYQGFRRGMKTTTTQMVETERRANITFSDQLGALTQSGHVLLQQFAASHRQVQAPLVAGIPITDATVSDQPVTPAPLDVMMQQMHREDIGTAWPTHCNQLIEM
jgi:hypothetical protein